MKLSYLPLEIRLVFIYCMMKILQSLIPLIQYKIHQAVINLQHRLNEICGSLLSMYKSPSQIKVRLINSITTKLHVENTRSRLVYAEGRATREHILKIFDPYLIKSYLLIHIFKFASQVNLKHQITLAKV